MRSRVSAAVLAAAEAAWRLLAAPRIAVFCGRVRVTVAALLRRLALLSLPLPLRAAVADAGVPGADRRKVGEFPLILRRGVIPLPLRHVVVLTCPAAARPAGE